MFRSLERLHLRPSEVIFTHILTNHLQNLEEFRSPFRSFFQRYIDEREDEQYKEEKTNDNFMQEKYMDFRLYPFYIDWKKIEENKPGYYRILVHFGYFGAAVFSSFKEKYQRLDVENIIYILAGFISEYLLKKEEDKTEALKKTIIDFFERMPNLDKICELIEKKVIMMKEVPLLIIILKIYEIDFILKKSNDNIEKVLKYEYLLLTYLDDEEYKEIYNSNFKGKVSKIFKKIVEEHGKNFVLAKSKMKFINNIRAIYKTIKQN